MKDDKKAPHILNDEAGAEIRQHERELPPAAGPANRVNTSQIKPSLLRKFPLDDGQIKRLITDQDEIQDLVDRSYDGSSDESYFTETAGINRFGLIICLETDGKLKAFECPTQKDAEAVLAEGKKLLSRGGVLSIY